MQLATFSTGCFWEAEEAFRKLNGVNSTQVGYSGGHTQDPTYKEVLTGTTGHSQSVQIQYDPFDITYEGLLRVFWRIHDPTRRNRQGRYIGPSYSSIIFYHTPGQRFKALTSLQQAQHNYERPVLTEVLAASSFHKAEEHHQLYLAKRHFAMMSMFGLNSPNAAPKA